MHIDYYYIILMDQYKNKLRCKDIGALVRGKYKSLKVKLKCKLNKRKYKKSDHILSPSSFISQDSVSVVTSALKKDKLQYIQYGWIAEIIEDSCTPFLINEPVYQCLCFRKSLFPLCNISYIVFFRFKIHKVVYTCDNILDLPLCVRMIPSSPPSLSILSANLFVCVYVCLHCMYVCMYVYIYVCIYVYFYVV